MPYVSSAPLESLFDSEPVDRVTRRTAERAQDLLLRTVRKFTPVDHRSDEERKGLPKGALKDSWEKGPIEYRADGRVVVTVFTRRLEAPHVEYPTRPHLIEPKANRGAASVISTRGPRGDSSSSTPEPALRFYNDGQVVFAKAVMHPGTQGSFMMHRAVEVVEREWREIAREQMAAMTNRRLR